MFVGENRELDQGGLVDIGGILLLEPSGCCPVIKTDWHVVFAEALLAVAQYQPFFLEVVVHFRMILLPQVV